MSVRTTHILGIIGAVVVIIATDLPWYAHEVAVNAPGAAFTSTTSYTLWDVTTLAPVLLVIAAAVGAVLLFAPVRSAQAAGIAAALCGLGIAAYCIIKMFDLPDLGVTGSAGGLIPGVSGKGSTTLDAGPFIGLLGGLLLSVSGFVLYSEAPEPRPGRGPTGSPTPAA